MPRELRTVGTEDNSDGDLETSPTLETGSGVISETGWLLVDLEGTTLEELLDLTERELSVIADVGPRVEERLGCDPVE